MRGRPSVKTMCRSSLLLITAAARLRGGAGDDQACVPYASCMGKQNCFAADSGNGPNCCSGDYDNFGPAFDTTSARMLMDANCPRDVADTVVVDPDLAVGDTQPLVHFHASRAVVADVDGASPAP